jgi:CheY-like chemotaxis protein
MALQIEAFGPSGERLPTATVIAVHSAPSRPRPRPRRTCSLYLHRQSEAADRGLTMPPRVYATAAYARAVATILVAEDDAGVRDLVLAALGRVGHTVVTARDGAEAMRVLEAREPAVDLLVSDINMPGLGGIELVSIARERADRLPILMMSGTNRAAFKPETIAADITVLEKPFTLHQLLEAVEVALAEARG